MAQGKYQGQQLKVLLETARSKSASGTFYINAAIAPDRLVHPELVF